MRRAGLYLLALLAGVFAPAAEAMAGEVNIYSYRKEALIRPQLEAFAKATGISYNLITGSSGNGFRDRIQDFNDKNAVILGLSFDSTDDNRAFKEKFEFPYDLLSDTDKSVSVSFGAATNDQEKASRVSVLIGPDGKIAKAYAEVKPADHPDQVLADLAKLG